MQTPFLSRSQSNAIVSLGGGCGADIGIRVGSVGGRSDVCHTLLGTGLASGMWAAPSPSEAYDYLIHWPNLYDWCRCGDPCQVNEWGKWRYQTLLELVGLPASMSYILSYIWQITTINTIIMIKPTPSQCTGWTEQPIKTKAAIKCQGNDFGKILGHTVRGTVTAN